jgi:ADP-heptose:LPS heptosyltransferase
MAFLISAYATILRARVGWRRPEPRMVETGPRVLCLTRGSISDMIETLSLFHALRRHYPQAQLTVACDTSSALIALACEVVNDVIVLDSDWNPWQAAFKNAARLQDHDWAIAAGSTFDRSLALLTRFTNVPIRIGFEPRTDRPSLYFTEPVALPAEPNEEHQVDTLLRLLAPLGLVKITGLSVNHALRVPDSARDYASEILAAPPFAQGQRFMLMNLSGSAGIKFREEDFIALAGRVLGSTDLVIGLVAAPVDRQVSYEIAMCMGSKRILAVDTPAPLDLAALLEQASLLLTPEGEAAHLAAAVETPTLILWSDGPFKKSHTRGKRHVFVHAQAGEASIPVERVWQALQPLLTGRRDSLEKQWTGMLELPPASD